MKAHSDYSLMNAFRDYFLCLMAIILFGFIVDLTSVLDVKTIRLANTLGVFIPFLPPLIFYILDQLVKWRNRRFTLRMIQKLKVRDLGDDIYVIKYPTACYELIDTKTFVWVTPEQLAQINTSGDAMKIIMEYKSK